MSVHGPRHGPRHGPCRNAAVVRRAGSSRLGRGRAAQIAMRNLRSYKVACSLLCVQVVLISSLSFTARAVAAIGRLGRGQSGDAEARSETTLWSAIDGWEERNKITPGSTTGRGFPADATLGPRDTAAGCPVGGCGGGGGREAAGERSERVQRMRAGARRPASLSSGGALRLAHLRGVDSRDVQAAPRVRSSFGALRDMTSGAPCGGRLGSVPADP